jgi:4-amino-4-deoxy-L-arabinose transferase-like glycosyltransferase
MGAFLALALSYAWVTPYRQAGFLVHQRGPDGGPAKVPDVGAPDERQHANYVAVLLQDKELPVLKPGSQDLYETYQSHQPPLYYVLAAAWCKALGADPLSANQVTGLKIRSLNALIGLVTLAGLFAGAMAMYAKAPVALAAAGTGLMPMCVALHGAVGNDPLLIALCTWCLTGLVSGLRSRFDGRWTLQVGVSAGLALLTKTTAVALLPAVAVGLLAGRVRDWKVWSGCLALPVAMAVPLWARNWSLYGDPFALRAFNEAFGGSPQAAAFVEAVGPWTYWTNLVLWWTVRSLIGVFGYMDVFILEQTSRSLSNALYVLMGTFLFFLLIVGFWRSVALANKDSALRAMLAPVAVFLLVVVLLFVRFNMQYFQGQGRYIYPALASVAWLLAPGVALSRSSPERGGPAVRATLWCLALGWLSLFAWSELGPAFALRTGGIIGR